MNKIALTAVLITILISGCVGQTSPPTTTTQTQTQTTNPTQTTTQTQTTTTTSVSVKEFKLVIDHSGYQWKDMSGSTLRVNKGDTVRILANSNQVAHNHGITIDALGVNVAVTAGSNDPAQVIQFTASQNGTFEIYCKTCLEGVLREHPQLKATLVVQ